MRILVTAVFEQVVYHCACIDERDPAHPRLEVDAILRDGDADGPLLLPVADYKRMAGFNVFYPIGWDDNGLPTEKRVQNYYGVRGDASLPHDPAFEPPFKGDAKSTKAADEVPISRQNFIELCDELTVRDEDDRPWPRPL